MAEVTFPALFNGAAAASLSLQMQLEDSQWFDISEIRKNQLLQINQVIDHAYNTVPFYRQLYDSHGYRHTSLINVEDVLDIPVLSRDALQESYQQIISTNIPQDHGLIFNINSSGSTDKSLTLKRTLLMNQIWDGLILRQHNWYDRDFSQEHSTIEYAADGKSEAPFGYVRKGWGETAFLLYKSGVASYLNNSSATIDVQLDWLLHRNPRYLSICPTNLFELARRALEREISLSNLEHIRTNGELLPDGIREITRNAFGVELHDIYESQEVGVIALQCPENGSYHIQSESVFVEVVDENNNPCKPGEIGRVLVTSLHNFATPLIRYEIGDYASLAEPCGCGRGLPVFERIYGRTRNMLKLPNGDTYWPSFGYRKYSEIAEIKQFQIIQKRLTKLEVRLVANKLSELQQSKLTEVIRSSMRYPFEIEYTYHDFLSRGPSNKFEEFKSEVL